MYDSDKTPQFFVQQVGVHNKYYITSIDEATLTAETKWGRIGSAGQQQKKTFSSINGCVSFIRTKISEKTRKGYTKITKNRFKEMSIQAAIIGSANKCHSLEWMEIKPDQTLKPATPERLADPNCNPALSVILETKKPYDGQNKFNFVFTVDKVLLVDRSGSVAGGRPITKQDSIYELVVKIEEAIGKSMCG